jgi:hypothetical protein
MKAEALFGGRTRFTVLGALAGARRPLTAYQIAVAGGLDPAATYRCLAEFAEFGIARPSKADGQTFYELSDTAGKAAAKFLRSLKQELSGPTDMDAWLAPERQAARRAKIARLDVRSGKAGGKVDELLSTRARGELSALIKSSRIAFDETFGRRNGEYVLRA